MLGAQRSWTGQPASREFHPGDRRDASYLWAPPDGSVICWGDNLSGQLNLPTTGVTTFSRHRGGQLSHLCYYHDRHDPLLGLQW